MFEAFEDRLTWPEYVAINLQACRDLRVQTNTPEPIHSNGVLRCSSST